MNSHFSNTSINSSFGTFLGLSNPLKPLLYLIIAATCGAIVLIIILIICRIAKSKIKKSKWREKSIVNFDKIFDTSDSGNDNRGSGQIDFSLRYDKSSQILTVKVIKVTELPDPIDECLDPYVVVIANSKRKRKERKTKTMKQTADPVFNEKLTFKLLRTEFYESSITFHVFDYDRSGENTLLGQLTVDIKDLDVQQMYTKPVKLSKELLEGEDILCGMGQVCVILKQASDGLTVTILEVKNLRVKELSKYSFVYGKIKFQTFVLSEYKTKVAKKTKKGVISRFPYFNETFVFQSDTCPLGDCRIKIELYMGGVWRAPVCVGYTLIGHNVTMAMSRKHWLELLDNPRHPVAKWHTLVNPNILY